MTASVGQAPRLNLLLVGAARSGTTALISDLGRHPDVFVTDPKETHFFAYAGSQPTFTGPGDDEMIARELVVDPSSLADLVMPGSNKALRVEGSVSTLYQYSRSMENIARHADPDVRIIVLLRAPAERAFSSYLYLVGRGYETAPDFLSGLELEDERVADGWHHLWHYRRMSRYGEQLTAFVDFFGRERIFIGLHEDYEHDPAAFVGSILEFSGLDPAALSLRRRVDVNRGGVPRSKAVAAGMAAARSSPHLKRVVRRVSTQQFRERIRSANLDRPSMPQSVRHMLRDEFEDDTAVVEQLIGRSLDSWRQ